MGVWFGTPFRFRVAIRLLAISTGAISAFFSALLLELNENWWAFLPMLGVIGSAVLEFVFGDIWAERKYPAATQRRLTVLEQKLGVRAINAIQDKVRSITQRFQACDLSLIRGTVHILVNVTSPTDVRLRTELLQLTDYIGEGEGKGRFTTIDQGVIGRCVRTGKRECVNFLDDADYEFRMVREFGFSVDQMKNHKGTARSYLAEPLVLNHKVIGVLYFDSTEPQVFPECAKTVRVDEAGNDIVRILQTAGVV